MTKVCSRESSMRTAPRARAREAPAMISKLRHSVRWPKPPPTNGFTTRIADGLILQALGEREVHVVRHLRHRLQREAAALGVVLGERRVGLHLRVRDLGVVEARLAHEVRGGEARLGVAEGRARPRARCCAPCRRAAACRPRARPSARSRPAAAGIRPRSARARRARSPRPRPRPPRPARPSSARARARADIRCARSAGCRRDAQSAPVSTARTPGSARARLVSMRRSRRAHADCAGSLRTSAEN